MTNKLKESPEIPGILLILKILAIFFFIGGVGALCGIKIIPLLSRGNSTNGMAAGIFYLIVSAAIAVPGLILLRLSGCIFDGCAMQGKEGETPRNDLPTPSKST